MTARAIEMDHNIGLDVKVRLEVAARLEFPDGSIGLSALRREASRGRLTVWRIANKDMTTRSEVKKMVDRCLRAPNQPDFGSALPTTTETPRGSSLIVDVRSAQAAAEMRIRKLKESSTSTLPQSTTPHRERNVVPIKHR